MVIISQSDLLSPRGSMAGFTRNTQGAPEFLYDEWADTGENTANMVKSSLIYQCAVDHDPVRCDFIWFALPDAGSHTM